MSRSKPASLTEKFRLDRVQLGAQFTISARDVPKLLNALRDAGQRAYIVHESGKKQEPEPPQAA